MGTIRSEMDNSSLLPVLQNGPKPQLSILKLIVSYLHILNNQMHILRSVSTSLSLMGLRMSLPTQHDRMSACDNV